MRWPWQRKPEPKYDFSSPWQESMRVYLKRDWSNFTGKPYVSPEWMDDMFMPRIVTDLRLWGDWDWIEPCNAR